ncbi:glycoside hydrolase family 43 protein [Niabella yanshanensis]|uniref:Glycoside hydrolase family 43 protein n=1 Tax=Niabella yanshanensis TaxID=577386 RepID=A0ABZ0W2Z5_9BACT|nr:glycoside hydrolase family 43 protein [Niabella yanshanensis]WQD36852.1 glycoside hydrolase family 43 protein [Niabella yanshanensis]
MNKFELKYRLSFFIGCVLILLSAGVQAQQKLQQFKPGALWMDDKGNHINAHGGGILFYNGMYYWFGEHKGEGSNNAYVGVTVYASKDLYNWKNEGVAFNVNDDKASLTQRGSIIERPKVIHNKHTKQFVMYFHLELAGQGYGAAYAAVAVSDKVTGPYKFLRASRVNPGHWPLNIPGGDRRQRINPDDYKTWWTDKWREGVEKGLFVQEHLYSGQMSRDMTLFVDDDSKAYHIYSSEENLTLHIAELSDDYTQHTGKYIRIAPAGHNEAPAIFKRNGKYYMITSGCTGWDPNAARLLVADQIMGEWKLLPNPCVGDGADKTFQSQGTYILPVAGKKDAFIFMADRWRPKNPIDGRYVWLPVQFKNELPVLSWLDEWDLKVFD